MKTSFDNVQRIVLRATPWRAARHLMISFDAGAPRHLLQALVPGVTAAGPEQRPELQYSLGLTRRGLERSGVPRQVMTRLALKAPAFWAGPALRAASHLGLTGDNAPGLWNQAFELTALDVVLSVHGLDAHAVCDAATKLASSHRARGMRIVELPAAAALPPLPGREPTDCHGRPSQWVHFGFRDGLSRIGIEGWTRQKVMDALLPASRHWPGEFVLGHPADTGADSWVAGPGLRVWPQAVRDFFRNGSFGVLQQVVQDVAGFETFVAAAAKQLQNAGDDDAAARALVDELKGKLCGRTPDGWPLAVPCRSDPLADFNYEFDPKGFGCPLGSHVRRMNPRLPRPGDSAQTSTQDRRSVTGGAAHFSRARPLLRRGLPYGTASWAPPPGKTDDAEPERGLIGQFFCASIEDQFEHLLGEWADRVPLGSDDGGGARDPLIGDHETGDGPFEIPQPDEKQPLHLRGLQPFVHTAGAAYLFYPSLETLKRIAENDLWREVEDEE